MQRIYRIRTICIMEITVPDIIFARGFKCSSDCSRRVWERTFDQMGSAG